MTTQTLNATTSDDTATVLTTGFGAVCFQQWCRLRGVALGYLPNSRIEPADVKWALNQLATAGIHIPRDKEKIDNVDVQYVRCIMQYVHVQEIDRSVAVQSR